MSLETDLYSYLSTYAGLTALVSTRIYPIGEVPQKVNAPYCVYMLVSNERVYSHNGFSKLQESRIQISVYSATNLLAKQIRDQMILAMEAWESASTSVQSCEYAGEQDFYESEIQLKHIPIDFIVEYGN